MNQSGSKFSLLIVDDDRDDQELFLDAINEIIPEATCEAIDDAEICLQKLTTTEIKPDVVFVDINMPKMNGFQFLAEAKKHGVLTRTKVVIYSTSNSLEDIQRAKTLGAHAFITKTNTYTELCEQLKNYLSRLNSAAVSTVMRVSDAIAFVLVEHKEFPNVNAAKAALLNMFRTAFPYWSFSEWDEQLSPQAFAILVRTLSRYPTSDLKRLILELIPIIQKLKVWQ